MAELRRLELRTRRSLSADVMGNYRSAFRGSGLVFADLREYEPGDEIRAIHWKATARSQKVYVKSYHEDRSVQVLLCVDVSASTSFGSGKSQHRKAFELAACVALLAEQSGDSVGLLLFGDGVEVFERPRAGRRAVEHLLLTLLRPRALSTRSDLAAAAEHILKYQRRRALVFVISDFYAPDFEESLGQLAFRHEVILAHLETRMRGAGAEAGHHAAGLVEFRDPESGDISVVDTSSVRVLTALNQRLNAHADRLQKLAQRLRVDLIHIQERVLPPLIELMRRRQSHRGSASTHVVGREQAAPIELGSMPAGTGLAAPHAPGKYAPGKYGAGK